MRGGCLQSKNEAPLNDISAGGDPTAQVHSPTEESPNLTRGNDVVSGGKKRATFEESYQLGKELGHGSFSTVREGTSRVSYIQNTRKLPTYRTQLVHARKESDWYI